MIFTLIDSFNWVFSRAMTMVKWHEESRKKRKWFFFRKWFLSFCLIFTHGLNVILLSFWTQCHSMSFCVIQCHPKKENVIQCHPNRHRWCRLGYIRCSTLGVYWGCHSSWWCLLSRTVLLGRGWTDDSSVMNTVSSRVRGDVTNCVPGMIVNSSYFFVHLYERFSVGAGLLSNLLY